MANEPQAPVTETPTAAPVVENIAAPVVETPSAPAAPVEAAPTLEEPVLAESLLEKATAELAAKDAQKTPAPPVAEPAKEPGTPAEAKEGDPQPEPVAEPLPPVEYKYALPETLALNDDQKGALHKALDDFRANPSEGAQSILDMGAKMMADYAVSERKRQFDVFNETRQSWNKEVMADPILGGAGHLTAMGAVARVRDKLVPSEMMADRKYDDGKPRPSQFDEFLRVTGAGDHPVFLHILHNAARYIDEPQSRDIPTNFGIPKTNGKAPGKQSLYDKPRGDDY